MSTKSPDILKLPNLSHVKIVAATLLIAASSILSACIEKEHKPTIPEGAGRNALVRAYSGICDRSIQFGQIDNMRLGYVIPLDDTGKTVATGSIGVGEAIESPNGCVVQLDNVKAVPDLDSNGNKIQGSLVPGAEITYFDPNELQEANLGN